MIFRTKFQIQVGSYHEKYWLVDFELHKGDFYTNIFNSKGIKTNIKFLMKIIVVLEKKKSMFLFYWMLILVILMVVIYTIEKLFLFWLEAYNIFIFEFDLVVSNYICLLEKEMKLKKNILFSLPNDVTVLRYS